MKRNTPLRRSRFKKKPARRIALRKADQPFRDWLHAQECIALEGLPEVDHWCTGRIEQSHGPAMTMGGKAPEAESWPACTGLHREWEEHRGVFKGWSKEARREFSKAMSEATQARWRYYQDSLHIEQQREFYKSRQPGVMVDGESPSRPEVVEPLKQPPAGEVYVCTHCNDVDVGQPCRQCGRVTLKMHLTDYLDMIVPF